MFKLLQRQSQQFGRISIDSNGGITFMTMRRKSLAIAVVLLAVVNVVISSERGGRKDLARSASKVSNPLGRQLLGTLSYLRGLWKRLRKLTCSFEGKHFCPIKCQQGTIYYPNGCCSCVCKKNFAVVNTHFCKRAAWSKWTSWSKCLKSDWGGLQIRERTCKSGGKETPGSCIGRGSKSKTCTPVKKDFRIRKNVNDLTNEELHDLIQGMTKFKKDTSKKGYRNIISWHGWPGRCPWYNKIHGHSDNHCSWHHHPLFLPWHRMITTQLELGLSRHLKNKTLGLPFWDWTEHSTDIPYLLRHSKIYDPVLKKFVHNPFHTTLIKRVQGRNIYTHRHPYYPGLLMDKYILKGTVRALLSHDYFQFDEQYAKNPHDQIHNCFCISPKILFTGTAMCYYGMPTVTYAGWDPAFLLHHSAIDRIFVMRRHLEELASVSDWTKSRVIGEYLKGSRRSYSDIKHAFDWPMSPFCNKSMNPEVVTGHRGVWTMHNGYYNEQLFGYKYANFNLGHNYTWGDIQNDYKNNVKDKNYWHDDYFVTKIGPLNKKNSYSLKRVKACTMKYSNPTWNFTIIWRDADQ